jgi:MYXO-CTERM domain-containing protein
VTPAAAAVPTAATLAKTGSSTGPEAGNGLFLLLLLGGGLLLIVRRRTSSL